jgi:serine/threonine-protein kinase
VPEEFGSYVIGEQLGVGGMATVHLAESRSGAGFRKRVALKRLLPHVAEDLDLVAAFVDEARLACYLRHPNIAQIFDFGKLDGIYYIAFEFVPGPTLQQLFRQCIVNVGSAIPIPVVVNIACQMCDALDYAHNLRDENGKALGIIHRDVSPPNLIVSNNGLLKLIDFGLAKAKRSSTQTQAGVIKGKLSYVAPEYLEGKLDIKADLWAVGVIVHELLVARRLFDADDDFKTLERVRAMRIKPPSRLNPEVPSDLDDIVLTALQRDPAARWQSAAAMRTALANVAKQTREVTNVQVISWIEWAFEQQERVTDSVSSLIQILDKPSRPAMEFEDISSHPAIEAAMLERRTPPTKGPLPNEPTKLARPPRAPRPPVGTAMLERRQTSRFAIWFVVLVVLGATVAAALLGAIDVRL